MGEIRSKRCEGSSANQGSTGSPDGEAGYPAALSVTFICTLNDDNELTLEYLLRAILMSTWGFWPAVFRPLRTVFPGLGAGFLNLGGQTGRTAKKWGKNGKKWARNGLKRVGAS